MSLKQTEEENESRKAAMGQDARADRWTTWKKFLTEGCGCDNLLKLTCEGETLPEQTAKRKWKKFLTKGKRRDKISKLLLINENSEEP